jgi:hypothetical protein
MPATDKTFEVKLDDNEDELFETPSRTDNLPFRIGLLPSPEDATNQVLEARLLLAEPPRPENLPNKFGFDIQSTTDDYLLNEANKLLPTDLQNNYFGCELPPKDARALFSSTTTNPVLPLRLGAHFLLRPLFRALNGFLSFPTRHRRSALPLQYTSPDYDYDPCPVAEAPLPGPKWVPIVSNPT